MAIFRARYGIDRLGFREAAFQHGHGTVSCSELPSVPDVLA